MKILLVHPSSLMYSEIYLRLEPLGLELVAHSAAQAGHDVRLLDLQIFKHKDYFKQISQWRPDAVGYSLNYLANIPEVVDLAKATKNLLPHSFIFAGGHSASFVSEEILAHAEEAIDCVVRGDGEKITPLVLEAAKAGHGYEKLPGLVTLRGRGPQPEFLDDLDALTPARHLTRKRKKYFIGVLDPCASIEFARGCPWDCSFCSAWTFYGRSYRKRDPVSAAEEMAQIKEPNVFIADDVAFIYPEHGMAIGREIERRNIKKKYYLETRGDVLLRNKEVFRYWKHLGLRYMFLGLEAIDEEGLKAYRKRTTLDKNFEALEFARSLGITVAVNIISDPTWDKNRFGIVREWAKSVPEIVHLTVNTPYPGTETWSNFAGKLITSDYRLFDVQHAVTQTKMPLHHFYKELVSTQQVLNKKHLGVSALIKTFSIASGLMARGQTNFVRMLWKFNSVYNPQRQIADHYRHVPYRIRMPKAKTLPTADFVYSQAIITSSEKVIIARTS